MFSKSKKNKILKISKLAITALLALGAIAAAYLAISSQQPNFQNDKLANNPTAKPLPPANISRAPKDKDLKTLVKGEADHISIPDRGIEAPIIYITPEENNNTGHQAALAKGVVHYPGTALPGEYGNSYIFGHSSDYFWKEGNYKKVFRPLVDIPIGTEIKITNHQGNLFVYKVTETKIVGPKDTSVLDQHQYKKKMLTLQTSWPIGTALKRYIVIAELDEQATYGTTAANTKTNQQITLKK